MRSTSYNHEVWIDFFNQFSSMDEIIELSCKWARNSNDIGRLLSNHLFEILIIYPMM